MERIIITGGRVYDPAEHRFQNRDVAVEGGRLTARLSGPADHRIDASGCLVTPGLIDYHVHYYRGGSENGVNADASSFCCGITTAVDGGTTGVGGYEHFRRTVVEPSEVRILSALLVASGGQSNNRYPENLDPRYFEEERILEFFERYGGQLVALKTRISRDIIEPELARRSLARTVEIAEKAGTRVVVHVTDCSIPLDELAAMLRPGDVICHIYHGRGNTCFGSMPMEGGEEMTHRLMTSEEGEDAAFRPMTPAGGGEASPRSMTPQSPVLPGLLRARERGVLFDACNGRSNFDLLVARRAISEGFLPDVISSDNNSSSWFLQPMHVLPRILSKFVDLGMTLEDVLDAATIRPAQLIGRPELGTLAAGTTADVAVWKWKETELLHRDIAGHVLTGHHALVPMLTIKGGRCVYCQADFN